MFHSLSDELFFYRFYFFRPGCSMPELYDLHDFTNKGKEPLCEKLKNREFGPFSLAYENPHYKVFKI